MSPLLIGMVLHYYCSPSPYDGPCTDTAFDELLYAGLLQSRSPTDERPCNYELSAKGKAYAEHLIAMPLPVCRWELPTDWSLEAAERKG